MTYDRTAAPRNRNAYWYAKGRFVHCSDTLPPIGVGKVLDRRPGPVL